VVVRVEVKPNVLVWARERSKKSLKELLDKFPHLVEWQNGDSQPTLKQLENFGRATHTPFGYLLLPEPPIEKIPIPDFRTIADTPVGRPSADLLDTLYICEQRQDWYRDFARLHREDSVEIVGSLTESVDVVAAADGLRETLGFTMAERAHFSTWTDALSGLAELAEEAGILVMISGIVGSNTRRKLDPEEFRGFSLVDKLAPVIFINGADSKAAQIFTLAHELAHIWLGKAGLDDTEMSSYVRTRVDQASSTEQWCNQVAAELLVPMQVFRNRFDADADLTDELQRLARVFKVSTLVILRRIYDDRKLSRQEFLQAFQAERQRVIELMESRGGSSGGNFYNTAPVRASKRFSRAVVMSTMEGQTLYRDASRLLGFKNPSTLDTLGQHLGVV
jgi:Zn-dependent peptidase ImmA (M78 family)